MEAIGTDSSVFRFSVYKRSDSKNWQVQFRDTSGHLIQRGTGTPNKLKAYQTAADWQANGLPTLEPTIVRPLADVFNTEVIIDAIRKASFTLEVARKIVDILKERKLVDVSAVRRGPGDQDLISFLTRFWDFSASPYIADRIAHGQRIGRRHCDDMSSCISVHWKPAFQDRSLSSITKKDIREFSVMVAGKGLAAATVNKILIAGTAALTWAKENDFIPADPGEGLRKFSGVPKIRGIFESDEVSELFKREYWPDIDSE